jgi:hypothetical protein
MKHRRHVSNTQVPAKATARNWLTTLIAVAGLLLAAFNTYWLHLRTTESVSVTVLEFTTRDPQPTNAYFVVEAVFLNGGNKQATVTDCTLILSETQQREHETYWTWDRKDALLLPSQEMRPQQFRYGTLVYNDVASRWPTGQVVYAQLEILLVDARGRPHKIMAPLGTLSWSHGLCFTGAELPKTITLLPSPVQNDPFPISRRRE